MAKLKDKKVQATKTWHVSDKSKSRHPNMDGEIALLDMPFSNGLMYPSAPGDPSESFNCKCSMSTEFIGMGPAIGKDQTTILEMLAKLLGLDTVEKLLGSITSKERKKHWGPGLQHHYHPHIGPFDVSGSLITWIDADGSMFTGREGSLVEATAKPPKSSPSPAITPAPLPEPPAPAPPPELQAEVLSESSGVDLPKPMLLTETREAFDDDGWIFQKKYDGQRAFVRVRNGQVSIFSRTHQDITGTYPEMQALASELELDPSKEYLLDGELVAFDDQGRSDIELLQLRRTKDGRADGVAAKFVAFDILEAAGEDQRGKTLEERGQVLASVMPADSDLIMAAPTFDHGTALFEETRSRGEEGIVAKRKGSLYESGVRSKNWVKIKNYKQAEVVIGGWEEGKGERAGRLGAVQLGVFDSNGRFIHTGNLGSGLSGENLDLIESKLRDIEIDATPFDEHDKLSPSTHFVSPEVVMTAEFVDLTETGKLRQPKFIMLRDDKSASDVTLQELLNVDRPPKVVEPPKVVAEASAAGVPSDYKPGTVDWRDTAANTADDEDYPWRSLSRSERVARLAHLMDTEGTGRYQTRGMLWYQERHALIRTLIVDSDQAWRDIPAGDYVELHPDEVRTSNDQAFPLPPMRTLAALNQQTRDYWVAPLTDSDQPIRDMNAKLRAGSKKSKFVSKMDEATATMEFTEPVTLRRGASLSPDDVMRYVPGVTMQDLGFASTEHGAEGGQHYAGDRVLEDWYEGLTDRRPVIFEIDAPAGQKFADMHYGEYVLPRGMKYEVISRTRDDKGRIRIHFRAITDAEALKPRVSDSTPEVDLPARDLTTRGPREAWDAIAAERIAWQSPLSSDIEEALQEYTGNAYGELNGLLRGEAELSPRLDIMKQYLDMGISAELPEDTVVLRSRRAGGIPLREGATWQDKAFVSTTLSGTTPLLSQDGELIRIVLPAGTKVAYANESEAEILLGRGSEFRVMDQGPDGIWNVELLPAVESSDGAVGSRDDYWDKLIPKHGIPAGVQQTARTGVGPNVQQDSIEEIDGMIERHGEVVELHNNYVYLPIGLVGGYDPDNNREWVELGYSLAPSKVPEGEEDLWARVKLPAGIKVVTFADGSVLTPRGLHFRISTVAESIAGKRYRVRASLGSPEAEESLREVLDKYHGLLTMTTPKGYRVTIAGKTWEKMTEKEQKATTALLDDYFSEAVASQEAATGLKTNWSGRIVLKADNQMKGSVLGEKAWGCDIILKLSRVRQAYQHEAGIATNFKADDRIHRVIAHEVAHSMSLQSSDSSEYLANRAWEEGLVELFSSSDRGLPVWTYSEYTGPLLSALRKMNLEGVRGESSYGPVFQAFWAKMMTIPLADRQEWFNKQFELSDDPEVRAWRLRYTQSGQFVLKQEKSSAKVKTFSSISKWTTHQLTSPYAMSNEELLVSWNRWFRAGGTKKEPEFRQRSLQELVEDSTVSSQRLAWRREALAVMRKRNTSMFDEILEFGDPTARFDWTGEDAAGNMEGARLLFDADISIQASLLDPPRVYRAVTRQVTYAHRDPETLLLDRSNHMANSLKVRGVIMDGAQQIAEWERVLLERDGQTHVYHSTLSIQKDFQGQGIATQWLDGCFRHYKKAGFELVKLHANISVGGYAWAVRGFDFDNSETSLYVDQGLRFLHELRQIMQGNRQVYIDMHSGEFDEVTLGMDWDDMLGEIENLIAREDGRPGSVKPMDIAKLGVPSRWNTMGSREMVRAIWPKFWNDGAWKDVHMHLGKAFLLGQAWDGVMYL